MSGQGPMPLRDRSGEEGVKAIHNSGKKGNVGSQIREKQLEFKKGVQASYRSEVSGGPAELQRMLRGSFMGFVLMLLAHRIQAIWCLFKIIASGVYWPYHEIEIMKALYLLKKIPFCGTSLKTAI